MVLHAEGGTLGSPPEILMNQVMISKKIIDGSNFKLQVLVVTLIDALSHVHHHAVFSLCFL